MVISFDGKYLQVSDPSRFKFRLNRSPGFFKWVSGKFLCEPTRANIEFLESEFPSATWDCPHLDRINALRDVERKSLSKPDSVTIDFEFKTTPYSHQRDIFARSKDLPFFAYFLEMGTGKTKLTIDQIAYLYLQGKIEGALIVAPNKVHKQFVDPQWSIHCHDKVLAECETFIYNSSQNDKDRSKFLTSSAKFRLLAMNVESFSSEKGVKFATAFLKTFKSEGYERPVMFVVDESSRIKHSGTNRTKSILRLGKACKYRRILSGTSITRGIEDLFSQYAFLSPDILGFKSFYTFKNRYCLMGGFEKKQVVGYCNVEELNKKVAPWTAVVFKKDVLDLPPKVYVQREVDVSDEQKLLYNQIRSKALLEMEAGSIHEAIAIVRMGKLRQILCGHLQFTDTKNTHIIKDVPRLDALKELIGDAFGQVVIWACHAEDINRICAMFKKQYEYVRYDGSVSDKQKDLAKERFLSRDAQLFIGNQAAGGIGLDWLVGPSVVVYYSNSFDAEHRWQSEDRNHRGGLTNSVTYYDLVAPKSIDSYMLENLSVKKGLSNCTLSELKNMLKEEL